MTGTPDKTGKTESGTDELEQALHIAVVDDESRIRESVGKFLAEAGLAERIDAYADPLSFLQALKGAEYPPDLVLLDVHFENAGLTGVEIVPFIREDQPYMPVILLTGMEGEAIEDAQDFECVYYIPKPVAPEQLVRMVRYYVGAGRKSGRRIAELAKDLEEHRELLDELELELADDAACPATDEANARQETTPEPKAGKRTDKAFERMVEILGVVLKNSDLLPSFLDDLRGLYQSDFKTFKKAVETIIRFDLSDLTSPGLKIHKLHGATDVYTLRLSRKVRIFFYQTGRTNKRRLIRIDPEHDTKGMDRWLRTNFDTYAGS